MSIRIVFVLGLSVHLAKCKYFENSSLGHMISIQPYRAQLWNDTDQDRLKKDLFVNYDRFARPAQHYNATVVKIGVSILHIDVDERKSVVVAHAWLRLVWADTKLSWNKEDYGNISVMRIADHEIWHPDLYLYNSALGGEPLFRFGLPNGLVYSNGEVLHVPPLKQTVLCEFDLQFWPFDKQHCVLKYGPWVHHGYEIELKLYNNAPLIDLSDYYLYHTWSITDTFGEITSSSYECCPEPFYAASFNFTITRNYRTYIAVVITPCVVNTLMIIVQFWLPVNSKQKLYLDGYLLVILSCYLLYFMDLFSGARTSTPLIVQYYACSLCILCVELIANLAAFEISRSQKLKTIEMYLQKALSGKMTQALFLGNYIVRTSNIQKLPVGEIDNEEEVLCDSVSRNMPLLVVLVNRLLFIIYLLTTMFVGFQLHFR